MYKQVFINKIGEVRKKIKINEKTKPRFNWIFTFYFCKWKDLMEGIN